MLISLIAGVSYSDSTKLLSSAVTRELEGTDLLFLLTLSLAIIMNPVCKLASPSETGYLPLCSLSRLPRAYTAIQGKHCLFFFFPQVRTPPPKEDTGEMNLGRVSCPSHTASLPLPKVTAPVYSVRMRWFTEKEQAKGFETPISSAAPWGPTLSHQLDFDVQQSHQNFYLNSACLCSVTFHFM